MDPKVKKQILDRLKAEGLDVAEDVAVVVAKIFFDFLPVLLAKISFFGKLLAPIIAMLKPKLMAELDKIDGKDDPNY